MKMRLLALKYIITLLAFSVAASPAFKKISKRQAHYESTSLNEIHDQPMIEMNEEAEDVNRAKKSATTTFCVEIKPDTTPIQVICEDKEKAPQPESVNVQPIYLPQNPMAYIVPEVYEPPVVQPAIVQPTVVQPQVVQPPMVQPTVVQPQVVQPSVMQPTFVQPQVVQPSMVQPTVVQPTMVQPQVVQPQVVQPQVVQPQVVQPQVVTPPVVQPPVVQPAIYQPAVVPPPVLIEQPSPSVFCLPVVNQPPPVVSPPVIAPPLVQPPVIHPPVVQPPAFFIPPMIQPPKPQGIECSCHTVNIGDNYKSNIQPLIPSNSLVPSLGRFMRSDDASNKDTSQTQNNPTPQVVTSAAPANAAPAVVQTLSSMPANTHQYPTVFSQGNAPTMIRHNREITSVTKGFQNPEAVQTEKVSVSSS